MLLPIHTLALRTTPFFLGVLVPLSLRALAMHLVLSNAYDFLFVLPLSYSADQRRTDMIISEVS